MTTPTKKAPLRIEVQVQPKSSRDEIVGSVNGRLRVRVAAPPINGKANRRLKELISGMFEVQESNVKVIRGATSRVKLLRVEGVSVVRKDWFTKNFSN